jgi:hypothetical protein
MGSNGEVSATGLTNLADAGSVARAGTSTCVGTKRTRPPTKGAEGVAAEGAALLASRTQRRGAKKVMSFQRTLVIVRDLVDQYGGVFFDKSGVHVVTSCGGKLFVTTIGKPTNNRLCSFGIDSLQEHDDVINHGSGGLSGRQAKCAWSPCAMRKGRASSMGARESWCSQAQPPGGVASLCDTWMEKTYGSLVRHDVNMVSAV